MLPKIASLSIGSSVSECAQTDLALICYIWYAYIAYLLEVHEHFGLYMYYTESMNVHLNFEDKLWQIWKLQKLLSS